MGVYRSAFTRVIIENGVTTIGALAFVGCTGLTSVTIPNSVTWIRIQAFANCTGLTEVINHATTPQTITDNDVFESVNISNITLRVPASAVTAYRNADVWKNFGTIATIEEAVIASLRDSISALLNENNFLHDSIGALNDSISGLYQQLIDCNSLNDTISAQDSLITTLLNNISALQNDATKLQDSIRELWRLLNECRNSGASNAPFMQQNQIEIYPNPVINELRITIDDLRIGEIVELFDMNGRRVFSQRINCQS